MDGAIEPAVDRLPSLSCLEEGGAEADVEDGEEDAQGLGEQGEGEGILLADLGDGGGGGLLVGVLVLLLVGGGGGGGGGGEGLWVLGGRREGRGASSGSSSGLLLMGGGERELVVEEGEAPQDGGEDVDEPEGRVLVEALGLLLLWCWGVCEGCVYV